MEQYERIPIEVSEDEFEEILKNTSVNPLDYKDWKRKSPWWVAFGLLDFERKQTRYNVDGVIHRNYREPDKYTCMYMALQTSCIACCKGHFIFGAISCMTCAGFSTVANVDGVGGEFNDVAHPLCCWNLDKRATRISPCWCQCAVEAPEEYLEGVPGKESESKTVRDYIRKNKLIIQKKKKWMNCSLLGFNRGFINDGKPILKVNPRDIETGMAKVSLQTKLQTVPMADVPNLTNLITDYM